MSREAHLSDIRTHFETKISAKEFVSKLDENTLKNVKKIEETLNETLDLISSMREYSAEETYKALPNFTKKMYEVYAFIRSLKEFKILAKSFFFLYRFLKNIELEQLEREDKRANLIEMLAILVEDLKDWINVLFVEQSAENIHYFDASFSANILQIENVFILEEECEDDGSDLEFF